MELDRGCKKFELGGRRGGGDSEQIGRLLNHESFRQNKARQAPGRKLCSNAKYREADRATKRDRSDKREIERRREWNWIADRRQRLVTGSSSAWDQLDTRLLA
jgi:hypothetical protein